MASEQFVLTVFIIHVLCGDFLPDMAYLLYILATNRTEKSR